MSYLSSTNIGTSTPTTPGGSDTQIQYNNAGAFGGVSGVITDGTTLTFLKTDDGAVGPNYDFYHNSASPAANNEIGIINYYGNDSLGNKTLYADITGVIISPTNGSESGAVIHYAALAGARTEVLRWGNLDANFKGLAVGTVSPIDPSGSNVTRFQAYNSALNACVVSVGGGGGSGNTFVIFDAGTTARQIRMGYISGYGLLDFVNMPASGALVRASNADITYQCGVAKSMVWGTFGGAEYMEIDTNLNEMILRDGMDITTNATTGTKIGNGGKVALFDATPIARPTTGIAEAAFVENAGGTAVNVDSTFGGYTLQQIAQALQNLGILT